MAKVFRYLRWNEKKLYLKTADGNIRELGELNTLKGQLTRYNKLRAVMADGEWIQI